MYVAYVEGWALYSEALCRVMDPLPNPATDFMCMD